jgi:hypothetical protein
VGQARPSRDKSCHTLLDEVKQWIVGLYRFVAYLYRVCFSVSYPVSDLRNVNKITFNKHTVFTGSSVVNRITQTK